MRVYAVRLLRLRRIEFSVHTGRGKRSAAEWPKLPRPSSTLPSRTFPFRFGTMGENIELLIQIQHRIIQCRCLANEISDPETSRRLQELTDEIERRAREVDQEGYTGQ